MKKLRNFWNKVRRKGKRASSNAPDKNDERFEGNVYEEVYKKKVQEKKRQNKMLERVLIDELYKSNALNRTKTNVVYNGRAPRKDEHDLLEIISIKFKEPL